jgi:hypothetical protein
MRRGLGYVTVPHPQKGPMSPNRCVSSWEIQLEGFCSSSNLIRYQRKWGQGWRSGSGAALLVGRPRDRFPVVSLDFSVTYFLPIVPWPGFDSAPSESTRNTPGGEGGRCVRLTTSPSSRAECHEIWEPKPPGTLWATPSLLRDSFTLYQRK